MKIDEEKLGMKGPDSNLALNPIVGVNPEELWRAAGLVLTEIVRQPTLFAKHGGSFMKDMADVMLAQFVDMIRQGQAVGGQAQEHAGQRLAQRGEGVQRARGVSQRIAGASYADDAQMRHVGHCAQGRVNGLFRRKQPRRDSGAGLVDAGIFAVAKTALHVAPCRHGQMNTAERPVRLRAETGMPRTVRLQYGHALPLGLTPKRMQSLGHAPTQSPQLTQFSSSGRVRMLQAFLHLSQSLHSGVL